MYGDAIKNLKSKLHFQSVVCYFSLWTESIKALKKARKYTKVSICEWNENF